MVKEQMPSVNSIMLVRSSSRIPGRVGVIDEIMILMDFPQEFKFIFGQNHQATPWRTSSPRPPVGDGKTKSKTKSNTLEDFVPQTPCGGWKTKSKPKSKPKSKATPWGQSPRPLFSFNHGVFQEGI
ncbi:MAG: hypothetical protein HQL89_11630 [Magnetococcales bacterium]|nr:hypothetical protein [Magnetococcales bacterium]